MLIVGLLLVVTGLVLAFRAAMLSAHANAGERMPVWRPNPQFRPPRSAVVNQMLAVMVAGAGGVVLAVHLASAIAFICVVLVTVPGVVVALIHNRLQPADDERESR